MVATAHGDPPLQRSTDRPDASIFNASACRCLRYGLRRIAWILSARFAPRPIRLACPVRGRQKECKRCEVYSVSKATQKAPSLSLPKNERTAHLLFDIFFIKFLLLLNIRVELISFFMYNKKKREMFMSQEVRNRIKYTVIYNQ